MANTILGALIGPLALAAGALFILNGGAQGEAPRTGELLLWGVMAVLTLVMLWFADVTAWSLHPLYKWRLARTFAVRRVVDPDGRSKAEPVPFKQLLHMSELTPDQFPGHQPGRPVFPELLVCASVNVSDQGTTPPGPVEPQLRVRPPRGRVARTGWSCPSRRRGGAGCCTPPRPRRPPRRSARCRCRPPTTSGRWASAAQRDITISAAVAMSGAAIAPSMGKMTRAPLRFLLALTNVRLGVWLPNPRPAAHLGGARQPAAGPAAVRGGRTAPGAVDVPVRHRRRPHREPGAARAAAAGVHDDRVPRRRRRIDPHVLDAGRGHRAGGVRAERPHRHQPGQGPEAQREAHEPRRSRGRRHPLPRRSARPAERPADLRQGAGHRRARRGTCRPTRPRTRASRSPPPATSSSAARRSTPTRPSAATWGRSAPARSPVAAQGDGTGAAPAYVDLRRRPPARPRGRRPPGTADPRVHRPG